MSKSASEFGVHPNQISKWKKLLLEGAPGVFSGKQERSEEDWETEKEKLFAHIGQLRISEHGEH